MHIDKNEITKKINKVFAENGLLVDDCDELLINYIPDSLSFINLVIGLEEEFDIELPDEFLLIQNLGTTTNLVERFLDLVDDL